MEIDGADELAAPRAGSYPGPVASRRSLMAGASSLVKLKLTSAGGLKRVAPGSMISRAADGPAILTSARWDSTAPW